MHRSTESRCLYDSLVEGRRPATGLSAPLPVGLPVGSFRDHRPDAASAQVVADLAGGVGLVGQDHVRPGTRTTALSGNTQAGPSPR